MRYLGLVCLLLMLCPAAMVVAEGVDTEASRQSIDQLEKFLQQSPQQRSQVTDEPFAKVPLTRDDAAKAKQLLWDDFVARHKQECEAEVKSGQIVIGEHTMPIFVKRFGDKPFGERSLTISMHGGGSTPPRVNDGQWENQKRLYTLEEGVYVAPRAPTNTWNLWHQRHIDPLFCRLILDMIITEGVDPNRVYIIGYSAGGDGVYQLAPRLADRWAGAAMMAGHPNETSPVGLRNTPFAIFMGGRDTGFNRNEIAAKWQTLLAELQEADPEGYPHRVTIYPNKGHWMDRQDAEGLPWLAQYSRNPAPRRLVWHQDDVIGADHFWLSVDPSQAKENDEVVVQVEGQSIELEDCDPRQLTLRLSDDLVDLEQPVRVISGTKVLWEGLSPRTIKNLASGIERRADPHLAYPASIDIELP